jgi:hypothetical protein
MKEYVTMFRCRDCGCEYKKQFQIMDEQKAREIIENARNSMEPSYFDLEQFDGRCCLDGMFTADELEAIAWWMRNKQNA